MRRPLERQRRDAPLLHDRVHPGRIHLPHHPGHGPLLQVSRPLTSYAEIASNHQAKSGHSD